MRRFVQNFPTLPDVHHADPLLDGWLLRQLGETGYAQARPLLRALAEDVAGSLRDAHLAAEADPPRLVRYDPWGARIDRVQTSPGWQAQREAAARHQVVGLPYQEHARKTWGAGARVVQHALLHLYGPESATFSCPVAMSDGAAALLSLPEVDPELRDTWLPRLISADPALSVTSGQWMTESQGGSDLSGTGTVAARDGAGVWRLTGDKWFCSAIDSAMAVALARPEGAPAGTRSLAPFLVPVPAPQIRVHRLKDKLGTRALPTAEVSLDGALAHPVGDPGQGGLPRMMTLVVITRLHNAAQAASGMRRGLDYARAFASARTVAGGRLDASPLHRATLGTIAVDAAAAFVLAGHGFALLGQAERGMDPVAEAELRLVAPLVKIGTGKLAVAAASELVECFGGAGYVEDTGIPRLLRDAQVLPIWEGTSNVLSLDVLRSLTRGGDSGKLLLARLDNAVAAADGPTADLLNATVASLRSQVEAAGLAPAADHTTAAARGLALKLTDALATALLIEHGDQLTAGLWARRRLSHEDISADAHRHYETLTTANPS